MVSILKPKRTYQLAARFCSAYLGKKGLMRTLMHIVRCGYPPDSIGAFVQRISLNKACRTHSGYPIIEDGYRAPNVAIWHQMACSAYSHQALSN